MVLDHHRSSMMRCPLKDADSVNPRGGVGHRRLWSMSLLLIFCHIMIILYLCCNKLSLLDIILKAPRLVFILILYLSNSTKQQILGRQCYLATPSKLKRIIFLTGAAFFWTHFPERFLNWTKITITVHKKEVKISDMETVLVPAGGVCCTWQQRLRMCCCYMYIGRIAPNLRIYDRPW